MSEVPVVLQVDPLDPDADALGLAAHCLRGGGLVAFPTETVYGLGANALDIQAVARIFWAKDRPAHNPLIVHVATVAAARALVRHWPEEAEQLAKAFWPGPLTLVLPRRPLIPDAVTAGQDSVAVRIPAHLVARRLIEQAGVPVAAPSANRYTRLSPTQARHVIESLGTRVDMIVDGGSTQVGLESTVVSLLGPHPVILRPGMLSLEHLVGVCPHITHARPFVLPTQGDATQGDATQVDAALDGELPQLSPGLARKHYAPQAEVFLADSRIELSKFVAQARAQGRQLGVLALGDEDRQSWQAHASEVMAREPGAYAARLYAALHAMDDRGCDLVVIETPPMNDAWRAIWDRLLRARVR